jgi:hypothetical protein
MLLIDDLPAPLLPINSTLRCFCRFWEFILEDCLIDGAEADVWRRPVYGALAES